MSSVVGNGGEERELLSRENARRLAEDFKRRGGHDPCHGIPRALLSAEHIIEYANATGMIAPLYDGKRMKKASYQGKIGKNAYEYDNFGKMVRVPTDPELVVKANAIVFVECDIDFRLPDFIAVRFNLHIRHVHRGLLLGTGPLVDPGYWGKLCIPLHNLTNHDYPIPHTEGLIWLEFTKTSGKFGKGRNPSSSNEEYWDVHKFIERSASQYGKRRVPIRSSIPVAVQKNRELAESAEESAGKSAEYAKETSKTAETTIRRFTTRSYAAVIFGILTVGIGIASLFGVYYGNIQSLYNAVVPQANQASERSATNEVNIDGMKLKIEEIEEEIRELQYQIINNQNREENPRSDDPNLLESDDLNSGSTQ